MDLTHLFIHSSADGHWHCFCLLAFMSGIGSGHMCKGKSRTVDTRGAIQRGNSMGKAKGLDARSEGAEVRDSA